MTFRNAVRGARGITDVTLGGLLRDCIGQEVATAVEQEMGTDENNDWFYGIIGGMELDNWLLKNNICRQQH
jgi:hypothetical protein